MIDGKTEYLMTGILYTLMSIPLEKRDRMREELHGKKCSLHVALGLLLDAARYFECQESNAPIEKGCHLN